MPQPIKIGRKTRMSYSKIKEVAPMPNLIDIQTASYDWFMREGLKEVFEDILAEDVQVIILGTGDTEYEEYFKFVASRYENKCKTIIAYNKDLASKIYSGSDIFLMPSKHEPCGLSQMIACKYGTIPVVRATGGLADSITAFNDEERKSGNGFKFYNYNPYEMLYVVKDAIFTFGDKKTWVKLIKNAIKTDFTWKRSACDYEKLYDLMLK